MALARARDESTRPPVGRRLAGLATFAALAASVSGVAAGLRLAAAAVGPVRGGVFVDVDVDGVRDPDEIGVGNVEVVVVDPTGRRGGPVRTADDGTWAFDPAASGLGTGPYRVEFAGWPPGMAVSTPGPDNGSSVQFVGAGTTDVSLGLRDATVPMATYGGRVWLDLDADGLQDPDEPGLAGVRMEMLDADGVVIGAVATEGGRRAGTWVMPPSSAGVTRVRVDPSSAVDLPAGIAADVLVPTLPAAGDARLDSDADASGVLWAAATGGDHTHDVGVTVPTSPPRLDIELRATPAIVDGTIATLATERPTLDVTVTNTGGAVADRVVVRLPAAPDCGSGSVDLAPGDADTWTCVVPPAAGAGPRTVDVIATADWVPTRGSGRGIPAVVEAGASVDVRVVHPSVALVRSTVTGAPIAAGEELTVTHRVGADGDVDLVLGGPARLVDDGCSRIEEVRDPATGRNAGDLDADGIVDVAADEPGRPDGGAAEWWQFRCTTTADVPGPGTPAVARSVLDGTATVVATPVAADGTSLGLADVSRQSHSAVTVAQGPAPSHGGAELSPSGTPAAVAVEPVGAALSVRASIEGARMFDADADAGTAGDNDGVIPVVAAGQPVTMVAAVRNDGAFVLHGVVADISPDAGACARRSGDPDALAPGEELVVVCTVEAGPVGAEWTVAASAAGATTPDGAEWGPVVPDGDDVDAARYTVASIALAANALDASGAPAAVDTALEAIGVAAGDPVTLELVVTNTGEVALTDVVVDDGGAGCAVPPRRSDPTGVVLPPGGTWIFHCAIDRLSADIATRARVLAVAEFDAGGSGTVVDALDPMFVSVQAPGFLGQTVWHDRDGNGRRDPDEDGLAGVTVELRGDGEVLATAETDADGAVGFSDLTPGVYQFRVRIPAGFVSSAANRGRDDDVDSDINPAGFTAPTTLDAEEHDAGWGAGLHRPGSLSGRVWVDADADGTGPADAPGAAGVALSLVDERDGRIVATSATDDSGRYRFDGLTPGPYRLVADPGAAFRLSGGEVTGPSGNRLVTLYSGETEEHVDFAVFAPASIGGRAWVDTDLDGFQDDDEVGLGGVFVRLVDGDGRVVTTATTDRSGRTRFDGLAPGRYRLEFVTPAGMQPSPVDAVGADDADSDFDPTTGGTAAFSLQSGEEAVHWDAGFAVPTAVLSTGPELNTEIAVLAFTGRTLTFLLALALVLLGLGGSVQILADRLGRPASGA